MTDYLNSISKQMPRVVPEPSTWEGKFRLRPIFSAKTSWVYPDFLRQ